MPAGNLCADIAASMTVGSYIVLTASDGRYSDDRNFHHLCSQYFYGGAFGREKNGKAEIPMGSFHGSGIFCNPGGGVGADQAPGDRIWQFLLDYLVIVRGRGNAGRNARVKSR